MNCTTKSAAGAAAVATKIAAKEAAKQAPEQPAAEQPEAKQKTKTEAKAPADETTKGEATKEVAEHLMSEEDAAPAKAKKDASSVCALVLIGVVAAAFCATFTPHMTKPGVASKLEVHHSGAVPPQWLPVLLASNSPPTSPPPVLTLNVTYYDFSVHEDGNKHSDSHPDFERGCELAAAGEEPTFHPCNGQAGLVEATLGDDGRRHAWHRA